MLPFPRMFVVARGSSLDERRRRRAEQQIGRPVPGTRCHTGQLAVTVVRDPGGGAAGTEYYRVVFTNTSGMACTGAVASGEGQP
jgi:hypothetical protein